LPLPPLHITAMAWLHFRSPRKIDLAALVLATNVPDLEPLIAIILNFEESHTVWHSYLAAVVLSIPLAVIVWLLERYSKGLVQWGYSLLRLEMPNEYRFDVILATCLVGWASHVSFDMWTHETFRYVLYPLVQDVNPFWLGSLFANFVEFIVLVLSLYSVLLWVRRIQERKSRG